MAIRFSGKFSAKAKSETPDDAEGTPPSEKIDLWFLSFFGFVFFMAGVIEIAQFDIWNALLEWFASFALISSRQQLQKGHAAAEDYESKENADPPELPRKLIGSGLIGLGVLAVLLSNGGYGAATSMFFAILASSLSIIGYGIDPLKKKRITGEKAYEETRVAKVIDKADAYLKETLDAIETTKDKDLIARVKKLIESVQEMYQEIEEDPSDLSSSRKHLTVYLKGTRDATRKFSKLHKAWAKKSDREEYNLMLEELEQSFDDLNSSFREDKENALKIEIQTMRERIGQS